MSAATRLWQRHVRWLYPPCIEGGGRASRGDAGDLVEVEGDGARAPRVRGKARVRFRLGSGRVFGLGSGLVLGPGFGFGLREHSICRSR